MQPTACGKFSPDGREFILARPKLDRPWMNVLSNGRWCFVASQLGGGYSFLDNPTVGRVTRWHVDGVPRDTVGKFVYLRDEETGQWWCANGYPPTRPLDKWQCHIGLGYNRIVSQHVGIGAEILYFTPMPDVKKTGATGDPCLIWSVKLANHSGRPRVISAANYVELAMGNWFEDTSWREFYLLFNRQEFKDGVIYTRSTQWVKYIGGWQAVDSEENNIPYDHAIFLASSAPVTGYEGDRYQFVGSYRDLSAPQAMDAGRLRSKLGLGRDACEALQHRFDLQPGQSVEYVLVFGAIPRQALSAKPLIGRYGTPEKAAEAFKQNQAYWQEVTASPFIRTPDGDLDILTNYWLKYQGANLSWWNRNTGYCYSGIYNFGVRDACQDAASRLPQDPRWVREHIVKRIMIWQFPEGDWAHGGNFVSGVGTRTFHSDDPTNPLFILAKYVRETGDYGILKEVTPYAHTQGRKKDTIYRHVVRGMEFFWRHFSKRGLPLILKADWNDALDQMGNARKGDSVMLACWAIYCVREFFTCMEYMRDTRRMKDWAGRIARLADTVNRVAWDGDWYTRAMHDSGWVLGTKKNRYGKIWSNPNSFAIVSDVADEQRRRKIYASFDKHLDHELGSYTFYPPFGEPEPRAGIISRFAPGTKENGAIFGHSSRWRIWAECYGGRGDKAHEIYRKMSPITRHAADPDLYRIEPYVACQFIYAPESGRPGEGSHSWATGTACWSLLVVWEWMLGVRPETGGLRVDPCLPSAWTQAHMQRRYRGAEYDIAIEKKPGICKGKVELYLDGAKLPENVIPPQGDGKRHQVRVVVE
jgi:cellobiose phosphorylase